MSDKKRRIWDKILMGAIIGGAIGSVLGGRKGKDTGDELKDVVSSAGEKAKRFFSRIKSDKPEEKVETELKQIPHEHDQV